MGVEPGRYSDHRAVKWWDETIVVNGDEKSVLKVECDIDADPWTCWVDDLYNPEGKPSANLRGLMAFGVTLADIEQWGRTGRLEGLDRNAVNLVVENNKKGYPTIKYVNDPNERGPMREVQPLSAQKKTEVARRIYAALKKEGAPASAPLPTQAGSDDDIPF